MRRVALFLLLLVAAAGCTSRDRAAGGDLEPTVILVSFDGWRWDYHVEGRRSEPAAPHRARRARRKPDSELSSEDISESLHDRHRPLSRPPRHRRQLDLRCGDRPHVHERQGRGSPRSDVVGRRADLGDRRASGAARPRRCSGLAPKRRSAACCRTTGRRTTRATRRPTRVDQVLAVARPAGGRASDVHRALLLRRR